MSTAHSIVLCPPLRTKSPIASNCILLSPPVSDLLSPQTGKVQGGLAGTFARRHCASQKGPECKWLDMNQVVLFKNV